MSDEVRQAATSPDDHTLSIEEAASRYEHAGHPRTPRSIQRYCAQGHLECLKQETVYGDKYLITPASVARHIAQISELADATRRDLSRQVATGEPTEKLATANATGDDRSRLVATGRAPQSGEQTRATGDDKERPVTTVEPEVSRVVALLERENAFLREEIGTKNKQIADSSERARETNILIKGLQNLVLQLQAPSQSASREDAGDSR